MIAPKYKAWTDEKNAAFMGVCEYFEEGHNIAESEYSHFS
jgi:hypothetical protein